jgi:hypothetical protein
VSLATGRHRLGRHWRKAHGRMMMMMTLAECRNNSTTKIYIPTWLTADATARWWSVACAKRIDKPRRLIFLTSHEYLHATIQTFVCVCSFSYNTEPNISRSSCFQFIGVVYMKTFHKRARRPPCGRQWPTNNNRGENDPWQTNTKFQSLNELKKTLNMCSHKENR